MYGLYNYNQYVEYSHIYFFTNTKYLYITKYIYSLIKVEGGCENGTKDANEMP